MLLSENYINRLQQLAGILLESNSVKDYAGSEKRVPFNKSMMVQAIKEGREVGLSFQTNNEKYKMPVAKWRVIYPVAIGLSKKGNLVIRAYHKYGQSESAAAETGQRSAEVENEWRLFNAANVKSMWFTGNFFRLPLPLYNANGDGSMISVETQANANEIIKFQDEYNNNIANDQANLNKRKNIVHLFKNTGERPVEQPIQNPTQQTPPISTPKPEITPQPKVIPSIPKMSPKKVEKKPKPGFDDQNPLDSL